MISRLEKVIHQFYHRVYETRFWFILALSLVLITAFLGSKLPSLKFNYDIEGLFANNDPEVALYDEYKKVFGNENDALLIGIESESGAFNLKFLSKIDTLTRSLVKLQEIERVISPTNLREFVKSPFGGFQPISMIHLNNQQRLADDSIKIYQNEQYVGSLFSKNQPDVALILALSGGMVNSQNESLLANIKELLDGQEFEAYHIAGRIQTQHYYIGNMKREMALFSALALFLFCGSIWLIFRQLQYIIIPLVVIAISLVWIFGAMSMLGIQVDLMLTILPSLMFVLSTSVCIHFLTKFHTSYNSSNDKQQAIKYAFAQTTAPNFLISVTTAAGLGSLYFIPVSSIQRLGLLASSGILITLLIGLIIIPVLLRFIPIKPRITLARRHGWLQRLHLYIITLTVRSRRKMISGFLIFSMINLFGISFVTINNKFLDDLDDTSVLRQDLQYFEDGFSGIRPFELIIKGDQKAGSILTHTKVKLLDSLEQFVIDTYGLGMVQSPVVLLKMLNRSLHGGDLSFFVIPDSEKGFTRLIKEANRRGLFQRVNVFDEDNDVARISGRMADAGRIFYEEKNEHLRKFLDNSQPSFSAKLTGVGYLIDNANTQVTRAFMIGLGVVLSIVILVISAQTRSVQLTLIALVVNLVPLLVTGALIGFMGISLKISTALIFTIVLGIAVDDTIHFLNKYLEMRRQYQPGTAIKFALQQMTKPIFFTSAVLFSGFMIFSLSSFESIQILGWLTGISLLIAMLSNFLLLPAILLSTHFSVTKKLTPSAMSFNDSIIADRLPNEEGVANS